MCLNILSGENSKNLCMFKNISASISYYYFNELNKRDKTLIFVIGFGKVILAQFDVRDIK